MLAVSSILAVVGLVAGVLGIGGWAGVSAYQRNRHVPAGPDLAQLAPIPAIAGDYVALGDSYSAGEGLQPFNAFTQSDTARLGNGCHRSAEAYSQLLRFEGPTPAQRFVACSGAVTSDVFNQFTISDKEGNTIVVPPQVAPGVHPEVGLVTITIGGNDVVFSSVVTHCFVRSHCMQAEFQPPDDNPARGISLPPPGPLDTWALAAIDKVQEKMDALYPALKEAYPNARIVVIGYPYLFPDRQAPYWNLSDCQTILRRFTHGERVAVRSLQDQLNQVLHDSAAVAGIEFISPAAGWKDHEPCGASEEQYTNSIKPFILFVVGRRPGDGGTFHPNSAGQRELAKLVTCYLVAHPDHPALTPPRPHRVPREPDSRLLMLSSGSSSPHDLDPGGARRSEHVRPPAASAGCFADRGEGPRPAPNMAFGPTLSSRRLRASSVAVASGRSKAWRWFSSHGERTTIRRRTSTSTRCGIALPVRDEIERPSHAGRAVMFTRGIPRSNGGALGAVRSSCSVVRAPADATSASVVGPTIAWAVASEVVRALAVKSVGGGASGSTVWSAIRREHGACYTYCRRTGRRSRMRSTDDGHDVARPPRLRAWRTKAP